MVSLAAQRSHNNTGIFVEIAHNTLYELKIIDFSVMPKIIRYKIMFHEDIYRKYIKT